MPRVFSYGSLQREDVQLAAFGRRLHATPDELRGFVLARSRNGRHANLVSSARADSLVPGMLLELTDAELASADAYERSDGYARVEVTLESGIAAWVFVEVNEVVP